MLFAETDFEVSYPDLTIRELASLSGISYSKINLSKDIGSDLIKVDYKIAIIHTDENGRHTELRSKIFTTSKLGKWGADLIVSFYDDQLTVKTYNAIYRLPKEFTKELSGGVSSLYEPELTEIGFVPFWTGSHSIILVPTVTSKKQ